MSETVQREATKKKPREVYLRTPERGNPGLAVLLANLRMIGGLIAISVGGAIGFGIGFVICTALALDLIYALVPTAGAAALAYWYIEFHRPRIREERACQEILKLAGSAAHNLVFNDGSRGNFSPKGAIWLRSRRIAIGLDPIHQLARFVMSELDWIHGLETVVHIEVREAPRKALANRVRRLMGLRLKTAMMLYEKDIGGSEVDLGIYPGHIQKARDLVRQINFHRQDRRAEHS